MLLGVLLGFAFFSLSFVFIGDEERSFTLRDMGDQDKQASWEQRLPGAKGSKPDIAELDFYKDLLKTRKQTEKTPPGKSVQVDKVKQPAANKQQTPVVAAKPAEPVNRFTVAKRGYVLQAGAFRNFRQANRLRADLALMGLPCYVQNAKVRNQTYHRVRLGPFRSRAAMQKAQRKLRSSHIETIAMRLP